MFRVCHPKLPYYVQCLLSCIYSSPGGDTPKILNFYTRNALPTYRASLKYSFLYNYFLLSEIQKIQDLLISKVKFYWFSCEPIVFNFAAIILNCAGFHRRIWWEGMGKGGRIWGDARSIENFGVKSTEIIVFQLCCNYGRNGLSLARDTDEW